MKLARNDEVKLKDDTVVFVSLIHRDFIIYADPATHEPKVTLASDVEYLSSEF